MAIIYTMVKTDSDSISDSRLTWVLGAWNIQVNRSGEQAQRCSHVQVCWWRSRCQVHCWWYRCSSSYEPDSQSIQTEGQSAPVSALSAHCCSCRREVSWDAPAPWRQHCPSPDYTTNAPSHMMQQQQGAPKGSADCRIIQFSWHTECKYTKTYRGTDYNHKQCYHTLKQVLKVIWEQRVAPRLIKRIANYSNRTAP